MSKYTTKTSLITSFTIQVTNYFLTFHFTKDDPSSSQRDNIVEGIDLDEMNEFAQAFKIQRLSLGLTQTQVGQALSVTEGPAYSQSAICR